MPSGGARPGSGRPKGKKDPETIEREKVAAAIQRRRLRVADRIFNAQLAIAEGASFVFEVIETGEGKSKKREHVMVTDPARIKAFLDGERGDNYTYITTEKPDGKMIADIFDRAFGKPPQAIEMTQIPPDTDARNLEDHDLDDELTQLRAANAEGEERERARTADGAAKTPSVN
jgi:hypothetical protein